MLSRAECGLHGVQLNPGQRCFRPISLCKSHIIVMHPGQVNWYTADPATSSTATHIGSAHYKFPPPPLPPSVSDLGLVVVNDPCVLVHDHKVNLEQSSRQVKLSLPPLLTTRGVGQGGTPAGRQAGQWGRQAAAIAAAGGGQGGGQGWLCRLKREGVTQLHNLKGVWPLGNVFPLCAAAV